MAIYEISQLMNTNRPKVSSLVNKLDGYVEFDLSAYINLAKTECMHIRSSRKPQVEPMVRNYLEFLQRLKKTFRGCSFVVQVGAGVKDMYGWAASMMHDDWELSPRIYMYLPTNRFASGWVSLGDFRVGDYGDPLEVPKISIWSPHITNEPTRDCYFQHSLKTTVKVDKALAVAKQYFKDENMSKVALDYAYRARDAYTNRSEEVSDIVQAAKNTFTQHPAFPAAMQWLMNTNVDLGNVDLQDELEKYVVELKYEAESSQVSRKSNMMYVRGYVENGEQVFDQVRLDSRSDRHFDDQQTLGTCKEADLSEDIKRKLSILMMGEDQSFVAGVGYKLDGEVYYVYE